MKRSADIKMTHPLVELPIRLHFRNDLHLLRKTFHLVLGLLIVFIYMSGIESGTGVLILAFFLGMDLFMESIRLRSSVVNEKILKFFGPILRVHEMNRLSTMPHYISAAMIAVGIFPRPVAILSLLYLACGDPMASLMGILYGHLGPRFANGKTWIGTCAGILVCAVLTFFFLKSTGISGSSLLALTVIGGAAGGMAELLPFGIDDNFTIPVISGFILWLGFMFFGL